jgi:hypothetical protein
MESYCITAEVHQHDEYKLKLGYLEKDKEI